MPRRRRHTAGSAPRDQHRADSARQQGLVVVRRQRDCDVFEPSEADIAAICQFRCKARGG